MDSRACVCALHDFGAGVWVKSRLQSGILQAAFLWPFALKTRRLCSSTGLMVACLASCVHCLVYRSFPAPYEA